MPSFYNPYFQPYGQQPYGQQVYGQQPVQMMQGQAQQGIPKEAQMQNGGFVSVRAESDVYSYPVAPGNCVTFKVEGKPIVLEKSMGFSQLEAPRVDRYRLVKEDLPEAPREAQEEPKTSIPDNSPIKKIEAEIEAIWGEIEALKNAPKKTAGAKKKEADNDTE